MLPKIKETQILIVSRESENLLSKLKQPGYCIINISSASEGLHKMLNSSFDLVFLAYSDLQKEAIALIERLASMYGIMVVAV